MNEKRISITIDDLPFVSQGLTLDEIEDATVRIHGHLERNGIHTVGFVIGEGVVDEKHRNILRNWQDKGHFLGNHTFSHLSLNKVPLEIFIGDIKKNEQLLKSFWETAPYHERYFRLPYLQWGTISKFEKVKTFLSLRSHTLAPVTVNSFDYIFNTVYVHVFKNNDSNAMENVVSAYLSHFERLIGYYERTMSDKIGRTIDHILLLHANLINANCLDRVTAILAKRGYCFPTLRETLCDPYYKDFNEWNGEDRRHFNQWWQQKGIDNQIEPFPAIDREIWKKYAVLIGSRCS